MDFSDVKKWHIALALPVFTAALTFSYLQMEPAANPRTTSPGNFEQALLSRPVGRDKPVPRVQNIRVYPPVDGLYTVNFDQLVEDRANDRWLLQPWSFTARSPRPDSNQTILEWLEQLRASNPEQVKFTYEWWREPKRLWTLWGVFTGVLLLWGVVIPGVLWLVRGGAKELKEVATMKPPPPSPAEAAAAASGPSAEDQARLGEMIDRLEEATAGMSPGGPGPAAAGTATATASAPKVLSGKPLEPLPELNKPEEPKEYKGEFYPVARPKATKHD